MASYVPTKIDLTPKRHHGYGVLLFILGTLFPPLGQYSLLVVPQPSSPSPTAVAARFGIGKDFWLNLLLTICGYIPGTVALPLSLRSRSLCPSRPWPQLLHPGTPSPFAFRILPLILSIEHSQQQESCPHPQMDPALWPRRHFYHRASCQALPMGYPLQRAPPRIYPRRTALRRWPRASLQRRSHLARRQSTA